MLNSFRKTKGNLLSGLTIKPLLFQGMKMRRFYSHVKHLTQIMETVEQEENQRKAKFLEYTHKVYKPSKTITFERSGEVLLFSVDNFRNSQVYTKYPYCLIDALIPLAVYNFFVNPCKFLLI
jgi:hypothetical protein